MGTQGKPVVGIPRWLTTANLLGIVLAFTLAIPFGARANHQPAPTGLTIFGRPTISASYAPTAAKLRWTDTAVGTTGYALQRSTSSSFNANVVEYRIAKSTSEFWDETFTRVGTFYYRIRSISGTDQSPFSNTVTLVNNSALTLPPSAPEVPTELAAVQEGSGIRFSWRDMSQTESFFRIERGVAEQGQNLTWEWRGNVGAAPSCCGRHSFLDTDPVAEPSYRVTVFNGKGSNRSYALGPVPYVPGVDTQGVVSMVNNIGSAVPGIQSATGIASPFVSMATAALPSDAVGTINGIVSPLASSATGLIQASGLQSTVDAFASATGPLVSPWTGFASGLASNANSVVASAGSVIANPTSILAPLDNIKIWVGVRITGSELYFPAPNGLWLWPAACAPGACPVPKTDPNFSCQPTNVGFDYCFLIKLG